ncbi:hypothetical protein D8674_038811 [Pyrus ussuriensis x Pyrus communis]|uniref:Uncharacterized protein n=1 Tax=Pyrus ussuriensis x Pyrus communis TaxID=2448454 RepID=A0A5N5H6E0_9ROSA|nr:hypothetical protein D8674_038811 [Pyrus ussuriensis x Pyrus communis]
MTPIFHSETAGCRCVERRERGTERLQSRETQGLHFSFDSGREGKGTSRLTNLRETVAPIFDSEIAGCRCGEGREGT